MDRDTLADLHALIRPEDRRDAVYELLRAETDEWQRAHADHTKAEITFRPGGEMSVRCSCGAKVLVKPPRCVSAAPRLAVVR